MPPAYRYTLALMPQSAESSCVEVGPQVVVTGCGSLWIGLTADTGNGAVPGQGMRSKAQRPKTRVEGAASGTVVLRAVGVCSGYGWLVMKRSCRRGTAGTE